MKTLMDLESVRIQLADKLRRRSRRKEGDASRQPLRSLLVCGATECHNLHARELYAAFRDELMQRGLSDTVDLVQTGCFGICGLGPVVVVYPEGVLYSKVQIADVWEIVADHLLEGRIVERLALPERIGSCATELEPEDGWSFFTSQQRKLLRNIGRINPERIDEAIASDGYRALALGLHEFTPESLIAAATESGLRCRNESSPPVGEKWGHAAAVTDAPLCVICNTNESGPDNIISRALMEGDPHSLLEAMAICGYAIGAAKGYIYVQADYALSIRRLQLAIEEATNFGLLGRCILGTDFCFEIEIRLGEGDILLSQDTALLEAMKGRRGLPQPNAVSKTGVYPFESGKAIVHDAETLSNVPILVLNKSRRYAGAEEEPEASTKILELSGQVVNPGICEVTLGTTLRELIFGIGGGIPDGAEFKAVQLGGPAGSYLGAEKLDLPIDLESLAEYGSVSGSPGITVLTADNSILEAVLGNIAYLKEESCGQCPICRIGLTRQQEILTNISKGESQRIDIAKLRHLAHQLKETGMCPLGKAAANPVLSSLDYFYDEYESAVRRKKA